MVKLTAGGVARNIADALGKLMPNSPPTFISAIGNDSVGHLLWKSIQHVDSNCVIKSGQNSSFLLVLLDQQRDCAVSIGDMSINGCITPEKVMKNEEVFGNCSLIVLDANLSEDTISCILTLAQEKHIPVWLEPTDPCIATKPFHVTRSPDQIHYCSPNLQELQKIVSYLNGTPISNISANKNDVNEVITEARDLSLRLLPLIPNMMVTLSRHGILMVTLKQDKPKATYYKAIELNSIENVSGVGDCLASGYIAAMLNGCAESDCVRVGLNAAVQSLLSLQTVPDGLRYGVIEKPVSSIEIPLTGEVNVG
ncbi:uncharacterized protein LOC135841833 [Planococcus citri]|uniref:uncharacterized protein LOC135841833 n=1 Tax=Planococcus citri TaxID=170843 RepID=UPI0031F854C5